MHVLYLKCIFLHFKFKEMAIIYNYIDSNDPIGLGYKEGEGTVGKTYKFKGVNKTIIPTLFFWTGRICLDRR